MAEGMLSICGGKQQVLLLCLIQFIIIVLMGLLTTYGPEARPGVIKNHSGASKKEKASLEDDPFRIYPRISLLFLEGFLLCGFLATFDYAPEANAGNTQNSFTPYLNGKPSTLSTTYTLYQDVHVMIFIGFGFLMAFLRRYGQSAIGLTFLIGAILVQVALLCEGFLNVGKNGKAPLSLQGLLSADVAVAAPLISMGAVLGKTTYMQLIIMGIIELIMYTANKYIGEHHLMAVDAGDSMYVHVFGAYFGLAVSFVFGRKDKPKEHYLEGSNSQSDIFAMIGTVFLWLFWPSFNSASLKGDDQQRAAINTLLSIAASCVISFAVSSLVSKENKFNMVHVQNSTLAGGVAIGTAAGMMCEPIGALVLGTLAGILSVLGYKYLTPLIQKKLWIHDTCGVHNLHGMPGVLAGIFGALIAGIATENAYNYSLYEIFPARAPSDEVKLAEMRDNYNISPGLNRSAGEQAVFQLLALVMSIAIAILSGMITGLILQISICGSIKEEEKFDDAAHWELDDESMSEVSKQSEGTRDLPMGHI